jgi:ribosomal protein S18 acetylase RimI-like enzyme
MRILPWPDGRFDELLDFVTRLNDDPASHIGYLGLGRDEIRHELLGLDMPVGVGFRLAETDDGRLLGVFGVEADPVVGRAWLYGPLVEGDDRQAIADALYAAVQEAIPPGIAEHELYGDVRNDNLAAFAARHDFRPRSETAILTLARDRVGRLPEPKGVVAFEPRYAEALAVLHDRLFPNTYFPAQQLIERRDDNRRLLLAVDGDDLLGYAYFQRRPEAGQSYLDFIGVDDARRGQGIGRRLLAAVNAESFTPPEIARLDLTVNPDNAAAMSLYRSFGFETERVLRGYRKTL